MNEVLLDRVVALAAQVGYALLATADDRGMPHVAVVGHVSRAGESRMAVSEWFCSDTIENLLTHNSKIALIAWDPVEDTGYQLLGDMVSLEDERMMNGFAPGQERTPSQVQRRLVFAVAEIYTFTRAPHYDAPALA